MHISTTAKVIALAPVFIIAPVALFHDAIVGTLSAIPELVAIVGAILVYVTKHVVDMILTRKSLALILFNELHSNKKRFLRHRRNGFSIKLDVYDDVYRGLLSSGNIRHLSSYQLLLHRLYLDMKTNNKSVLESLDSALIDIEIPATHHILWWRRLCRYISNLCSLITTRLASLRRSPGPKSAT